MSIKREKIIAAAQKHIQKGSFRRAIKEYQKIVKAQPDDVRILQKVGDLQARDGQIDAAVSTYNEVADHYVAQGFFLKAVAVYKQLLRIAPDKLEARLRLADLYIQLSLVRDALANYQVVADRYLELGWIEAYLGTLERIVEVDVENPSSRILFAEQLLKYEHRDLAAEQFQVAIEQLYAAGRFEEYCKVAERYVHLRPDDAEAIFALAETYLEQDRPKRALVRVQSVFRDMPDDPQAMELLVRALDGLGERSRAVAVLEDLASTFEEEGALEARDAALGKLLELAPNHSVAREVLGVGEAPLPEAVPLHEQASAVEQPDAAPAAAPASSPAPTVVDPAAVEKLLSETDVYLKYNLYDKALEHLQQVFTLDPQHLGALERRQSALVATGQTDGAIQTLIGMARIAVQTDEVQAHMYLHQALAIRPDDPAVTAVLREFETGVRAEVPAPAAETLPAAPAEAPAPPVGGDAYRELDALFSEFENVDSAVGHKALDEDEAFIAEVATTIDDAVPADGEDTTTDVVSLASDDLLPADLDLALERVDALATAGDVDAARTELFALLGEWPGHDEILLERMNALSDGDVEAPQHSGLATHDTVEVVQPDLPSGILPVASPSDDDDDLFLPEEDQEEALAEAPPASAPRTPANPTDTAEVAFQSLEEAHEGEEAFSVPDVELPETGGQLLESGRITGQLEVVAAGELIANVLDGAAEAYAAPSTERAVDALHSGELEEYGATEEIEIISEDYEDDVDDAEFEDVDDMELDAFDANGLAPAGRPSPALQVRFGPSEHVMRDAMGTELATAIAERRKGNGMVAIMTLQEETLGDFPRAAAFELALANIEMGLYVDGIGGLERLLTDQSLSASDRLLVHYHIGVAYEALHQPDAASPHLRRVASRDPINFPDVAARLGRMAGESA